MPKILISYRRDDSAGMAGRLYDRLETRFGRENVFMDIDAIPLGVDFRDHLRNAVGQCDVLLAVIGKDWFGRNAAGDTRLDDPRDFVRIEIEAALARGVFVIPVLIDRVRMPAEAELPTSLTGLAYRNAIELDHGRDFHGHVDRLIRGIEHLLSARPPVLDEPPKLITNSIGMNLVLIRAGEFLMGSPDSDKDALDEEKPRHRVRITRPFYLGATAVTVGQFRKVAEATGLRTEAETDGDGGLGRNHATGKWEQDPKYTWRNPGFAQTDDHPLVNVSWNDAVAFCNKLSEQEALKPDHLFGASSPSGGDGYRLPTEAEWDYACRAGSTTRFHYGDNEASLGEYAWFRGNSNGMTHPVGQKRANARGLRDMHGNVWEWCWDGYAADYYKESPGADPLGLSQASARVFRGGGWNDDPRFARSADRRGYAPGYRDGSPGFRLARVQSGR